MAGSKDLRPPREKHTGRVRAKDKGADLDDFGLVVEVSEFHALISLVEVIIKQNSEILINLREITGLGEVS